MQENLVDILGLVVSGSGDNLTDRAMHYSSSEEYGEQNSNANYFIFKIILPLFYVFICLLLLRYKDKHNHLFKMESLIIIGVAFYLLQVHMKIAYRYVDYYSMYFVLLFSETYVSLIKNNLRCSKMVLFLRSTLLFLPYFLLYFNSFRKENGSQWYYPYSSIIEKSIELHRECHYDYEASPNEF